MLPIILLILFIIYRNKVIKYIKKNLNMVIIIIIQIIVIILLLKRKRENLENTDEETKIEKTEIEPEVETEETDVEINEDIEINEDTEINTGEPIMEQKAEEDIIEDPKKTEEHEVKLPGEEVIAIQPVKKENVLERQLSQIAENKYNILPTDQWVTPNAKDIFKQTSCMCPQVSSFNDYYSIVE